MWFLGTLLILSGCFAANSIASDAKNSSLSMTPGSTPSAAPLDVYQDILQWLDKYEKQTSGGRLSCRACRSLLELLRRYADTNKEFVAAGKKICSIIDRFANDHVREICHETATLQGPVMATALRNMGNIRTSQAAGMFCNNILQTCPLVNPEWIVPIKERQSEIRHFQRERPKLSGRKGVKIVHFSDIHIDPHYRVGSNANCNNPVLCCRDSSSASDKDYVSAGPFGHLKTCDSTKLLEESMYKAIKEHAPDAEFAIFTGDIIERQVQKASVYDNRHKIGHAFDTMKYHFKQVFPAVGNHESSPANSFPPSRNVDRHVIDDSHSSQWLYDTLSRNWTQWLGEEFELRGRKDISRGGRYSVVYRAVHHEDRSAMSLRIISLNTNFYSNANLWLYQEPLDHDPDGQLKWLADELHSAEVFGEMAYIIGHMPMGDVDAIRHTSRSFNQVVNRYSSTIAAMFFGHTHVDQIQLTYSDYEERTAANAKVTSYIAPSLTPSDGMPAFKVYNVDARTYHVTDSTTYMADMNNETFQYGPVWKKYYSAKELYGIGYFHPPYEAYHLELSPQFWHKLTKMFEVSPKAFKEYLTRKTRGVDVKECDDECRRKEICLIRGGRAENNCHGVSPRSGKRDESSSQGQINSCGRSVGLDAFTALLNMDVRQKLREALKR
ncbi:hypothetical protein QQS21_006056 [Conoideocrella luteorostrata]|uniref:Sphingomyelin phosphodiesterase n=1 Tax=Conoideocrella luteorostrata TaxID=1105319 RepID=A0AAJ0FYL4_9HYPO|nr:hypothetical protein QQS21_006056 [Conoideocrella luteorostrata]